MEQSRFRGTIEETSKHYIVLRHRVSSALRSSTIWWRLFFAASELWLIVGTVVFSNPKLGGTALVGFLVIRGAKVWKQSAPTNIREIERSSKTRAWTLYELNLRVGRWPEMSFNEVKAFQRDVLRLIASYARDHRGDTNAKKIFVNLLEVDGDELVVTARNERHRTLYARHSKQNMLAWRAIQTGTEAVTGDVYADFPTTPPGKKYRSILALPVLDSNDKVVAAVTIDSSEKHHFNIEVDEIVMLVQPLIGLIGWTVKRAMELLPSDSTEVADRPAAG